MNNFEFYNIVLSNLTLLIIILLSSFFLHYLVFKKHIKSIFDPYLISAVSNAFCFAVVCFLYFLNNISFYLFISYLLTQLFFVLGLNLFSLNKNFKNISVLNSRNSYRSNIVAFYFFSIIFLISQIAIYVTKGIPLFMDSRLETFSAGGGSGILGRIADVSSIFSIYAFFLIIKFNNFKFNDLIKYLILLLILLTFFLSGSKSNFLIIFSVFWCSIIFNKIKGREYFSNLKFLKKAIKPLILFSFFIVLLIIKVQSSKSNITDENSLNPILAFVLRLVHSGDVYWYSYPNNVYLSINGDRWFSALFTDTLGLLRVVEWDKLPEAIGITLKNIHHPSDIPQGPNARHNVFGIIYFGFLGSIVFSFCLGFILSFIRNKLPQLVSNDFLGGGIFTYLMCKGSAIDTDPMLTITYFDNLIFVFPILFICYLFIKEIFSPKIS